MVLMPLMNLLYNHFANLKRGCFLHKGSSFVFYLPSTTYNLSGVKALGSLFRHISAFVYKNGIFFVPNILKKM